MDIACCLFIHLMLALTALLLVYDFYRERRKIH